ncbi:hypothetical protein EYF80_019171 [Liparis tanakae]|uniref:Uncharacterized protein n=1 Tax=Liparis tanakae TaxID=230148 RepID=A0A4Z2HY12_9TELE|nr:hypothetical protein EYF80_019171 [Liparis tanakae]
MFTHDGRDDCRRSRARQQLLDETVAIVERLHQSPLLPGTLRTETDPDKESVGYRVDGFLHIWLGVAVVKQLQFSPRECCLPVARAGTAGLR